MQQDKIPVLCTRPLPEWLLDEALQNGIAVDTISFIETQPIDSIEVQQEIETALLQSAVVVFTSMNAVEAVAAQLEGQQPDWQVYCMGHATRKLVVENFGEHCLAGTAPDAAALADLIVEESDAEEVIFFCGDQRRDELPSILQDNAIDVNEIVVYETTEVPHKVDKEYWGVLFFSPSAVRSFFRTNKVGEKTVLFSIGQTTSAAIRKYAANTIVTGDEPSKENLVEKMIGFFS